MRVVPAQRAAGPSHLPGSQASIRKQIGNAVPPLLAERIARAIAPEVFADAGSELIPTEIDRLTVLQGQRWEQLLGLKEFGDSGQRTLFDLVGD